MVAYIDFFLGGDEKRLDMVTSIQKRFPTCILFGGAGSYMSPYNLHSYTLLTSLIGQVCPFVIISLLLAISQQVEIANGRVCKRVKTGFVQVELDLFVSG